MRKTLLGLLVLPMFLLGNFGAGAQVQVKPDEPDAAQAKLWWPEQYNVWTPLGWPDHYFKYAVLYNGTVMSVPSTPGRFRPHSHKWAGEDFEMTFCASADGHGYNLPTAPGYTILREWDGGLGIQEWDPSHDTPVLNTEFRSKDGIVIRMSMFAHVEGGKAVETAVEPQYLWMRLEVVHVDEYYHPETYTVAAMLTQVYMGHVDYAKLSPDIGIAPTVAVFPKSLEKKDVSFGGASGSRLELADGRTRLGVIGGDALSVVLTGSQGARYDLAVKLPAKVGAHADLILPSLPQEAEVFDREAGLSFEKALAESDSYWASRKAPEGAVFDVPEEDITKSVEANLKFTSVIAEKDCESGDYSYLSGTWCYDALWATPGSMVFAMFMDPMGQFEETERYTEVFAKSQGIDVPKGPAYKTPHPGYFCVPRHVESVDWLTDHGAIMYQIATHGLLSGDKEFIDRWTEPLVKACDFIIDYSMSEHAGVPGLLPAAWATDEEVPLQAVWILAWCYKGMKETARLLEKAGHPRAAEFTKFVREYRERFQTAYRKICENGPKWTDSRGNIRFRPPNEMVDAVEQSRFQTAGRPAGHTHMTDAFYLDGGPLSLVWAGLMDADDPIMKDMVAFFREGPNWRLHKPFPWSLDRAVLEHEISSCEPCYSWNVFHSWQLGDRERYLEGMYSILIGAVSQNTYISCEHRHGIQGTQFAFPLGFCLARLAVIDDQIEPGSLHLLRMCPLAWIKPDYKTKFLRMATEFGPVDLEMQLSQDGKTLEISFSHAWGTAAEADKLHGAPAEVTLHVPPVPGLKSVRVNGKKYSASKGEIKL